ncbi:MAG: Blue light- and temperature-regulated antirepressor YcgF [Pseudomonadota bacterium]|jgi:hypothetical protein
MWAMLERLIYRSQATQPLGNLHLCHLLASARRANARHGITGQLAYAEGAFLQCLEGPALALSALWRNLLADTRHHSVELMDRQTVDRRLFDDWSLAFSSSRYQNTYGLPGFFHTTHDPLEALMERLGGVTHH